MSKRKYQNISDTDFSILWGFQPFWEVFFEYFNVSRYENNSFVLICKNSLKAQQKYCYRYFLDGTVDLDIRYRLGANSKYFQKYFPSLRSFILKQIHANEYWFQDPQIVFPSLKELVRIDILPIDENGYNHINYESIPNLERLILSNKMECLDISQEDMEYNDRKPISQNLIGLRNCPNLRELMLGGYYCIDDTNLLEIQKLTKLEKLDISQFQNYYDLSDYPSTNAKLFTDRIANRVLSKLTGLKSLTLNGCCQIIDFSFLTGLNQLEELSLANTCITCEDLLYLKDKTHLKKLSLIQALFSLDTLAEFHRFIDTLASLKQVEHLCLAGLYYFNYWQLDPDVVDLSLVIGKYTLPDFSKFRHLKSICIYNSHLLKLSELKIADKILERIPNIETIYLHPSATDDIELNPKFCCRNCREEHFYSPFSIEI